MSTGTVKLVTSLAGAGASKTPILSKAGLKAAAGKLSEGTILHSAIRAPKVAHELSRHHNRDA